MRKIFLLANIRFTIFCITFWSKYYAFGSTFLQRIKKETCEKIEVILQDIVIVSDVSIIAYYSICDVMLLTRHLCSGPPLGGLHHLLGIKKSSWSSCVHWVVCTTQQNAIQSGHCKFHVHDVQSWSLYETIFLRTVSYLKSATECYVEPVWLQISYSCTQAYSTPFERRGHGTIKVVIVHTHCCPQW